MSTQPRTKPAPTEWQVADATELYRISSWGDPFFFVNANGHMAVRALDEAGTTIDVVDVVNELRRRGVQFPVLLRFQDVLRTQVRRVNEAFRAAIAESNYGNVYRGIYPIKVNQLHEVVDELLDAGRPYGMGLECGSKAELIACLPQIDGDTLLVCNGVKDRAMLSLMIAGQKLGQNIVPVIEKYSEFNDLKGLAFSTGLHVAARRARAARDARLGPLVRIVGHELEVRPERGRAHADDRTSSRRAASRPSSCCCIAISAARSRTSRCSRRRPRRSRRSTRSS